jgi:hypothetical protein
MDYLSVATLLALPRMLNASDRTTMVFTVVALTALVYSLLTRYELGLFKALPMTVHLVLDFLSGALLLAARSFCSRMTTRLSALLLLLWVFSKSGLP